MKIILKEPSPPTVNTDRLNEEIEYVPKYVVKVKYLLIYLS